MRVTVLGTVALLLLSTAPAATQESEELRWTPEKSMEFKAVSQTAISPDGERVAYVVRVPVMEGEKSEYLSHVWLTGADGTGNVQFTRGEHSATSPAFSPDGEWLAFTSRRGNGSDPDGPQNQVWVISVHGGEAFAATDAEAGVGAFRWSPDGSRIAYLMRDPDTEEEKTRRREKRDPIFVDQNFKYNHIYSVAFDPDAQEPPDATRHTEGDFHVTGFDWSPNGGTFAFSHQADPRLDEGARASDLSTVATDGNGAVTPIVTMGGTEGSPRYSPDGTMIAFTSSGETPQRVGLGDVYVVDADGGEPRKLSDSHDRSGGLLGWTRDGSAVLLNESLGTTRHITALPVDGGPLRQITSGDGVLGAASFASDADRMAFTWQTTDSPADVHVSPGGSFQPVAVTDLHDAVEVPPMGRTELLSWQSQDGRFEIEGLLTYPVDYDPNRRYPLILNVHGGPAGVYSQSFTGSPSIYNIQYFAQEGYAVLRPNPRGSTGYGREFRFANVRDWGFGDMDDLMAGVDEVVDMEVAHPDSLLLMGWSYGGYMTSFAVTRTDRFKAASMGAGLPNLVSMVTTTDIGEYLVAHLGGEELWEDYEGYERHSAMYRIANVKTPTQVIHGENDLRVPFTQGQEFYRALGRLGVPTEMVVLPRTPHGPREPKLLMEVSPIILRWFDRHLRPDSPRVTMDGSPGSP
ncbi:MAG: S9 family peptidase [Gemmatimonadetes bacterium]|nr:S9 family peptidase [Gemmatimonadota bacterium]